MYESFLITHIINMQSEVVTSVTYIDTTCHSIQPQAHASHLPLSNHPYLHCFTSNDSSGSISNQVFRKVSTCLKPRWLIALHTFTDTFQGCYKNGTNGTRDYRAISGYILATLLVVPLLQKIITLFILNTTFFLQAPIILFTVLSIACVVLEPYKHRAENFSGAILPAILALIISIVSSLDTYKISTPVILLCVAVFSCPHFVFYGYGILWLAKRFKQCATTEYREEGAPCRLERNRDYSLLNTPGEH